MTFVRCLRDHLAQLRPKIRGDLHVACRNRQCLRQFEGPSSTFWYDHAQFGKRP